LSVNNEVASLIAAQKIRDTFKEEGFAQKVSHDLKQRQ
jgi:hypothetical protein